MNSFIEKKEFFKGNEEDEDNPPLNTITNVEFIDNPDGIEGFKYGTETIFMFDKAGNIAIKSTKIGTDTQIVPEVVPEATPEATPVPDENQEQIQETPTE